MERESTEDILYFWLAQNDGKVSDWGEGERKSRIVDLIALLRFHKYSKDEIKALQNQVIFICHNPNSKGRGLKAWQELIKKDFKLAVAESFPIATPDSVEPTAIIKFEKTPAPADYVPKTGDEVLRTETESPSFDTKIPDYSDTPVPVYPDDEDSEQSALPRKIVGNLAPPLDRSIFDGLPEPEIVYDEELRKLLGFK